MLTNKQHHCIIQLLRNFTNYIFFSYSIIPQLPLDKWLFTKYGTTKSISVEKHYENKFGKRQKGTWEWLVGDDYNNDGGTQRTLDSFSKVAKDREALYIKSEKVNELIGARDSYAYFEKMKKDFEDEKLLKYCNLEYRIYEPDNTSADENLYYVAITYCPAYFMQNLANMSTSVGPLLGRPISGNCKEARNSFIKSSGKVPIPKLGGMEDPHTPITYYLIVYNNFVDKV